MQRRELLSPLALLLALVATGALAGPVSTSPAPTFADCQAAADAFCNSAASGNCRAGLPATCQHSPLVARLLPGLASQGQGDSAWRCFSPSVLSPNGTFVGPTGCYCTRDEPLTTLLTTCLSRVNNTALVYNANITHAPPGTPPYNRIRIPALLATAGSALLALGEGRRAAGDTSWSDILLRRSLDGGRSWSPARVLAGAPRLPPGVSRLTYGNCAPLRDDMRNQTLLVFCVDNAQVFVMSSADAGASWTAPRNITASATRAGNTNWTWVYTGPPGGLQVSSGAARGRLLVPSHHAHENSAPFPTDAVHMLFSDDHGASWQLADGPAGHGGEWQVAELGPDHLLGNSRSDKWTPTRRVTWSRDGGRSWTPFTPALGLPMVNIEGSTVAARGPGGQTILFYSNALAVARRGQMLYLSCDLGANWRPHMLLWAGPSEYSSLQVLSSPRAPTIELGILYSRGVLTQYDEIVFQRLQLEGADQLCPQ